MMGTYSRASVVVISGHRHHPFACVVTAILDPIQNRGSTRSNYCVQGQILANIDLRKKKQLWHMGLKAKVGKGRRKKKGVTKNGEYATKNPAWVLL